MKKGKYGEGWYTGLISTIKVVEQYNERTDDYEGFSQTGGYFECRCKVPKAVGIWSAFWLMPDNTTSFSDKDIMYSGEDDLEIDVMESPYAFMGTRREKNQNVHVLHADGEWEETWCGNPDKNKKDQNYDFVIDYVKCYKK